MSGITDRERRQAAYSLRRTDVSDLTPEEMDEGNGRALLAGRIAEALCIGHAPYYFDAEPVVNRLADLIEPSDGFDLDAVQRVCSERMGGCREPERTLYTTIYDAIRRYKRGESGRPDAGACDRDALLALADEIDRDGEKLLSDTRLLVGAVGLMCVYALRIREACGEAEE